MQKYNTYCWHNLTHLSSKFHWTTLSTRDTESIEINTMDLTTSNVIFSIVFLNTQVFLETFSYARLFFVIITFF